MVWIEEAAAADVWLSNLQIRYTGTGNLFSTIFFEPAELGSYLWMTNISFFGDTNNGRSIGTYVERATLVAQGACVMNP